MKFGNSSPGSVEERGWPLKYPTVKRSFNGNLNKCNRLGHYGAHFTCKFKELLAGIFQAEPCPLQFVPNF